MLMLSSGPWGWRSPWKWFVRWEDFDYATMKTHTFLRNEGNGPFYKTVKLNGDGIVNRLGLPNGGILAAEDIFRSLPKVKQQKTIVSLATGPKDLWNAPVEFLHLFQKISPPPPFFELNISCPSMNQGNSIPMNYSPEWRATPDPWQKLFDGCVYMSSAPLLLKVSVNTSFLLIEKALGAGFYGICASNSRPGYYPGGPPDEGIMPTLWGFSGPLILGENLIYMERLRKAFPKAHIIGGGGIYQMQDAFRYLGAGASSLALGSVYLRHPWRAREIARQLKEALS